MQRAGESPAGPAAMAHGPGGELQLRRGNTSKEAAMVEEGVIYRTQEHISQVEALNAEVVAMGDLEKDNADLRDLVTVQNGIITRLRAEMAGLRARIAELEAGE